MNKFFSMAALAAVTMLLGGCGGDSFEGSTTGGTGTGTGTGTTPTVATLAVTTSTATIPADGSAAATITVVAKDSTSAPVAGVTVAFTASAGTVTATQGTTDSTGTATASLVAGSAAAGSTITVTASSGSASGQTTVMVANTQKTLTLLTSIPQIPSDGSTTATISAVVRDANNNFVTGDTVAFSATSGGLQVSQPTTDASGTALAKLTSAGDPTNRTITVTATDGSAKTTVTVGVIGTKLNVTGPATLIQNANGTLTVSLVDAAGNGISGQTVTLTSSAGNTLTPASFTTTSTGQGTITLTAVNAGTDTITATGLGMTATTTVSVSNQNFAFTAPANNTMVALNTAQVLTLKWLSGTTPQANQPVSFSSTRGTLSANTGTTDANGQVQVSISSTQSGPGIITATATGVSAQTSLDFVATNPSQIIAQAAPATIPTLSTSTITVTVRDANNNLVEGQKIDFTITQDVTGGSLSTSQGTTNVQGQTSTTYTSTATTSATNGVVITATVASNTAITSQVPLTVSGQASFVSLATTNKVTGYVPANAPPNTVATEYILPYSVLAHDNSGAGIANVPITLTVVSLGYGKGYYIPGSPWTLHYTTEQPGTAGGTPDQDQIVVQTNAGCLSEDLNNNGILDPGEDYNGNGKLDPGQVAQLTVSNVTTGSDGAAAFSIIYPQNQASWVIVRVTATATVSGTQTTDTSDFWLPVASGDIATATVSPPDEFSPYGQAATCQDKN